MSILLLGLTKCPICKNVINDDDIYCLFPPFVANTLDRIYFVHDASFHLKCLTEIENGKIALEYSEEFILKTRPQNRICIISKELITKQEDLFFIGYLSSDKSSNLHRFNFIHIHRLNLPQWAERGYLTKELIILRDSGKWREGKNGDYLNKLIAELTYK